MRLFHKEDECYIVAEGSFAEMKNPIIEDGIVLSCTNICINTLCMNNSHFMFFVNTLCYCVLSSLSNEKS